MNEGPIVGNNVSRWVSPPFQRLECVTLILKALFSLRCSKGLQNEGIRVLATLILLSFSGLRVYGAKKSSVLGVIASCNFRPLQFCR